MGERILGKILIDDDHAGSEVRSYSGQPETVFRRVNLEIGIGNDGWYRAQHHGANEDRHRRNALRHDNYHAVAMGYPIVAEQRCLHTGPAAEFAKRHRLAVVLVKPRRNEGTACRGRVEGIKESAILGRYHAHLKTGGPQADFEPLPFFE